MAEREAIDLDSGITRRLAAGESITPEELAHIRARRVQVLGRSYVNANLQVDLPPHMHGEWVPNDPIEIHRKQSLGYWMADQKDYKLSMNPGHSDGTGKLQVADVVFMVTPKVNQMIIEDIRQQEFQEMHGSKNGKQKEERDFAAQLNSAVPSVHGFAEVGSQTHTVDGNEIKAATTINQVK